MHKQSCDDDDDDDHDEDWSGIGLYYFCGITNHINLFVTLLGSRIKNLGKKMGSGIKKTYLMYECEYMK